MNISGELKKLVYLFPVFALGALLYASIIETQNIAVTHDELWDYYPAVGMLNAESLVPKQEVVIFGFPLPLVTGPYQGALKTWLTAPVLKILGTSPAVLRGINVLLGLVYLSCLYWALSAAVPKRMALWVFLVPLADPNILIYTPMDYGPFLTQAIFIALAIGCLSRYILSSKIEYLAYGCLAAGFLLAQKLTSLPVVLAYFMAMAFFTRTAYANVLKGKRIILFLALFFLPLIPHLLYLGKSGFADLLAMTQPDRSLPFLQKIAADLSYFISSFNGADWTLRNTGLDVTPAPAPLLGYAGMVLIILSLPVLAQKGTKDSERKTGLFYLLMFAVSLIVFAFFKGLDRPWHYHLLHPEFILAMSYSIHLLVNYGLQNIPARLVYSLAGILLLIIIASGMTTGWRLLKFQNAGKGFLLRSLGLYDLERELEQRGAKKIICLNYSLCNPLYVLSGGSLSAIDCTWTDKSDALLDSILQEAYEESTTYIIYRHSYYNKAWGQDQIAWLNEGSTSMFAKMPSLSLPVPLKQVRLSDGRETEFGLLFFH